MIPGETFGNVHYAINYLHYPDVYELGDNVAIIGAGNAAMDVARTAIRHGSRNVTVYVRDAEVSASKEEYEYAMLDGVQFEFNQSATRILDDGMMVCETGNPETEHFVPATTIIIAISQVPQDRLVNRDKALRLNRKGNLKTDENGETTMEGVFASGDVVTGAKTVVDAVAQSKKIADEMDAYMRSL
jgi:glutamate synthase (NADPH/NADH) small chain